MCRGRVSPSPRVPEGKEVLTVYLYNMISKCTIMILEILETQSFSNS